MASDHKNEHNQVARRDFVQATTLAGAPLTGFASHAFAQERSHGTVDGASESRSHIIRTASEPKADQTTADILVATLIEWGGTHVFGMVGDGINPIIEAIRKRKDEIQFVGVRHEEAAAFMAGGFAKHTGRLGICIGTTGPGAIHLMNGLYDASFDCAPVLAITGTTFHDLSGTRFMQGVDTVALMQQVAQYNVQVTGPAHALIVYQSRLPYSTG